MIVALSDDCPSIRAVCSDTFGPAPDGAADAPMDRRAEEAGSPLCAPITALAGSSAQSEIRRRSNSRSEEHTSELQSLMRISYAVFCLKKKTSKEREQQSWNDRIAELK